MEPKRYLNKAKIQSSFCCWWYQFSVSFPRGLIPKVQYLFGGEAGHLCALGRQNKVAPLCKPYKGHQQSSLKTLWDIWLKVPALQEVKLWMVVPETGGNCDQSPPTQRHWLEIFLSQLAAHIWDRLESVAQSRKRIERKQPTNSMVARTPSSAPPRKELNSVECHEIRRNLWLRDTSQSASKL